MQNLQNKNLTTRNTEAANNIEEAAHDDAGFEAFLLFKKGEYFIDEEEIQLGTEYLAHPEAWVKVWRKFAGAYASRLSRRQAREAAGARGSRRLARE